MIRIRFTRTGVIGITKNELRQIGRATMLVVGMAWWKMYLPIHFMKRAVNRYGYRPRQGDPGSGHPFRGSYQESKLKRRKNSQGRKAIGEVKPLVFTGDSRDRALAAPNIKAVAQNFRDYRADVAIDAPALNFVPGAREEVLAGVVEEELELQGVFADEFERQISLRGRTQRGTKTIG